MTLDSAFSGNRNSLNALRLVMAALVIVAHSWWLTGLGPGPAVAGGQLGSWAVVGFFAISGYLITLSRMRLRSGGAFFGARFLRIMPGLTACLLVIAFVFAPIVAILRNRTYGTVDATDFVLRNLSLFGTQLGNIPIGSTLSEVPGADNWNSPLWTLFWEVLCYALVGTLAYLKPELFRAAIVLFFAIFMGALVLNVMIQGPAAGPWGKVLCPIATFLAGSVLCLYRSWVSMGRRVAALAAGLLIAAFFSGSFIAFCPLPLAYLILRFGSSPLLHRIGSRYDISYGMYIYGWPVQQLLVVAGLGSAVPLGVFAVLSLVATAPLAWLSCVLVELPAQRFGLHTRTRVLAPISVRM